MPIILNVMIFPQVYINIKLGVPGWLSQLSIWLLVLAQVMISQVVSLSPALGSVLTVQIEPA